MIETGKSLSTARKEIFESDFVRVSEKQRNTWDLLRRSVYFEPGDYTVKMEIKTDKESRKYYSEWKFEVDNESFENLRLNAITTIYEVCWLEFQYNYAYVPFQYTV